MLVGLVLIVALVRGPHRLGAVEGIRPRKHQVQLLAVHHTWLVGRHGRLIARGAENLADLGGDLVSVVAAKGIAVHREVQQCLGVLGALGSLGVAAGAVLLEDRPGLLVRLHLLGQWIDFARRRRAALGAFRGRLSGTAAGGRHPQRQARVYLQTVEIFSQHYLVSLSSPAQR